MKKEMLWAPALVVLALFFAGGVYSQLEAAQSTQEATQRGIEYLAHAPHLDSELLVLHWASQAHPDVGLDALVQQNVEALDAFHAPLKGYLEGKPLPMSDIPASTLETPFYPEFVSYFACEPLTPERIHGLSSLSRDDSEFGVYHSSHALLLLQLLKDDYTTGRCAYSPEFESLLDEAIQSKSEEVQHELEDRSNLDAWVEKIAVLAFVGNAIAPEHLQFLLDQQSPDGGWRGEMHEELNETNPHTTALAVWALVEAST